MQRTAHLSRAGGSSEPDASSTKELESPSSLAGGPPPSLAICRRDEVGSGPGIFPRGLSVPLVPAPEPPPRAPPSRHRSSHERQLLVQQGDRVLSHCVRALFPCPCCEMVVEAVGRRRQRRDGRLLRRASSLGPVLASREVEIRPEVHGDLLDLRGPKACRASRTAQPSPFFSATDPPRAE